MLADQPVPEPPLNPIQRLTPADRVAIFNKESNSIYKKYSVYDQNSGPGLRFGSRQPFVYITVASSDFDKKITSADSQAIPLGSTLLDVKRVTKFAASGTGVLYIGKQYLLQKQNAFNETRIYNPLSLISATAAKGSTGLIERPVRFLPTSGGIGNFIGNSLLSLVGIQSKDIEAAPDGTATGATISSYVSMGGGTVKKGLLRYESGDSGRNRFNTYFPSPGADPTQSKTPSLGSAIGKALINKLKSFIPSTNPFGFGGNTDNKWEIRPEYKGNVGAYEAMYADKGGMLAIANTPPNKGSSSSGFVDTIVGSLKAAIFGKAKPTAPGIASSARTVNLYHRYTPTTRYGLAPVDRGLDKVTVVEKSNPDVGVQNYSIYNQIEVLKNPEDVATAVQYRKSTERLKEIKDNSVSERKYQTYAKIGTTTYLGGTANNLLPNITSSYFKKDDPQSFEIEVSGSWESYEKTPRNRPSAEKLSTVLDSTGKKYGVYKDINSDNSFSLKDNKNKKDFFTYPSIRKSYSLKPTNGKSGESPENVYDEYNAIVGPIEGPRDTEPKQLVNEKDKKQSNDLLFFYFYDLVNGNYIPFRATLNGMTESNTIDWETIQYLGRADKLYLYKGFDRTINFNFTVYANSLKELVPMWKRINYLVGLGRPPKYTDTNEVSSFMYPPMVTIRIGDMYYDQPGVITSISITPSDEVNWESYRGSGADFDYFYGSDVKNVIKYDSSVKSLQLPRKVDIGVNMNLMEKEKSLTSADHFNLDAKL
jgi:hypothetical protein